MTVEYTHMNNLQTVNEKKRKKENVNNFCPIQMLTYVYLKGREILV